MSYKTYSQTGSGWTISTDPDAKPDKLWRATHPQFGELFFKTHDEILPYLLDYMRKRFKLMPDAMPDDSPIVPDDGMLIHDPSHRKKFL